jgi:hypothetical protein
MCTFSCYASRTQVAVLDCEVLDLYIGSLARHPEALHTKFLVREISYGTGQAYTKPQKYQPVSGHRLSVNSAIVFNRSRFGLDMS